MLHVDPCLCSSGLRRNDQDQDPVWTSLALRIRTRVGPASGTMCRTLTINALLPLGKPGPQAMMLFVLGMALAGLFSDIQRRRVQVW